MKCNFSQTIAIHFLTFLSKNKEISFEGYGDKQSNYNFENNELQKPIQIYLLIFLV